jgi:hypothetical protein
MHGPHRLQRLAAAFRSPERPLCPDPSTERRPRYAHPAANPGEPAPLYGDAPPVTVSATITITRTSSRTPAASHRPREEERATSTSGADPPARSTKARSRGKRSSAVKAVPYPPSSSRSRTSGVREIHVRSSSGLRAIVPCWIIRDAMLRVVERTSSGNRYRGARIGTPSADKRRTQDPRPPRRQTAGHAADTTPLEPRRPGRRISP